MNETNYPKSALVLFAVDVALFADFTDTVQSFYNLCTNWADEAGMYWVVGKCITAVGNNVDNQLLISSRRVRHLGGTDHI